MQQKPMGLQCSPTPLPHRKTPAHRPSMHVRYVNHQLLALGERTLGTRSSPYRKIDSHSQINASYLINTPPTLLKFYQTPFSNTLPSNRLPPTELLRNTRSQKKEQNHSIHSVSCLINEALRILSCSMLSPRQVFHLETLCGFRSDFVYAKFYEINIIIRPSCYFHRHV